MNKNVVNISPAWIIRKACVEDIALCPPQGTREVKWEVKYNRITISHPLNCLNIPITRTVEHCNFSPDFSNYPIWKDYNKTGIPFRFPLRFEKLEFPWMDTCSHRNITFAFWKTISLQYYIARKQEIAPEWALGPIRIRKTALRKLVTLQLASMI